MQLFLGWESVHVTLDWYSNTIYVTFILALKKINLKNSTYPMRNPSWQWNVLWLKNWIRVTLKPTSWQVLNSLHQMIIIRNSTNISSYLIALDQECCTFLGHISHWERPKIFANCTNNGEIIMKQKNIIKSTIGKRLSDPQRWSISASSNR